MFQGKAGQNSIRRVGQPRLIGEQFWWSERGGESGQGVWGAGARSKTLTINGDTLSESSAGKGRQKEGDSQRQTWG